MIDKHYILPNRRDISKNPTTQELEGINGARERIKGAYTPDQSFSHYPVDNAGVFPVDTD
jgi:hypothetical protein